MMSNGPYNRTMNWKINNKFMPHKMHLKYRNNYGNNQEIYGYNTMDDECLPGASWPFATCLTSSQFLSSSTHKFPKCCNNC